MSYTIHYLPQHLDDGRANPDWLALRCGRLTASVAGDMLSKGRGSEESAGRRKLRIKLVLERINNRPSQEKPYISDAMRQGTEREAEARAVYEALTGDMVENTGFIAHDSLMVGASLDGCVFRPDGTIERVLELKCPEPSAHLAYLRTGKIGADYEAQICHQLWLTGADSCCWMSYQPEFKEKLQTRLITITRESWALAIAEYENKALAFLAEVDAEVRELEAMEAA